ncbi:hypothetical protein EV421DRAFT_1904626 [Armillaria borealis]|uniref:Uncharacterized protein n=1 Tax=Armillaria borealis TaxID=47425 RepID=A0AA39MPL8_9AGAR|nr:hypothetical protein EV421DRAFT_1904626 [Armillaria borealis]
MSSALTSLPAFSRTSKFQLLGLVQPLRAAALPAPAPSVPAMLVLARLDNANALKPIAIATHAFARPASASAASA